MASVDRIRLDTLRLSSRTERQNKFPNEKQVRRVNYKCFEITFSKYGRRVYLQRTVQPRDTEYGPRRDVGSVFEPTAALD